jgi:hypothetical protein
MKKRSFNETMLIVFLSIATFASAMLATKAPAAADLSIDVNAVNHSNRAVWYQLWWSQAMKSGWEQFGAFCLKPNETRKTYHTYKFDASRMYVSVHAEVKKTANDCGGRQDTVKEFVANNDDLKKPPQWFVSGLHFEAEVTGSDPWNFQLRELGGW